jgi:quinohemoprotein ethanol dehydrogenase
MNSSFLRAAWLILPLLSSAVLAGGSIVDDTTLTAVGDGSNWPAFGRNYSEQRFSPLDQINPDTVARLRASSVTDLPGDRALVATPLVVDGVIYFTGSYSVARAVDAVSGKIMI